MTIASHSISLCLLLALLAACLIRLIDGSWQTIVHLIFLLRWFVIPILLLHALLTPGQLLLPEIGVPMTLEGLDQGIWLSVHLSSIFAAAILLSRILLHSEWLQAIRRLPILGKKLLLYSLMISPMKSGIGEQIQHLRQQWRLRNCWIMFPQFLLSSFRLATNTGLSQAQMLWLRWPAIGEFAPVGGSSKKCSSSSLLMLLAGIGELLLAWQL